MDYTTKSCRDFVAVLASDAPAPGGGGAAALAGALGTALGSMVGALTVGKRRYAAVESEINALMARCRALQEELLDQVPADAEGFLPLARAYGIPKDDPSR
ncbi:MAG: cyclodeaminase/cyclohydrolase family protein, partial [Flavonifractor sp.]|nr:cyclodeaminase/cyclohydrolase family protein [Flavonifractor sp.]